MNPADDPRPSVVAVVLTWNDLQMVTNCVQSLQRSTYPGLQIVVVDNGSAPPGCPVLQERFPDAHMVQLDKNYGFTGGCNRGMERALELGADFVFLLNNDTLVDPAAVGELVAGMEARPDTAMASALLLNQSDEKVVFCHQCTIQREKGWTHRTNENTPWTPEFQATVETGFAPACAVMFRARALREVGMFDESLFTNWEDWDLCIRIANAGWKMIVVGKAEVVHAHGQTTGTTSPFITYLSTRNRLICIFRHGNKAGILRNLPFILRSFLWQAKDYGLNNWECHRAFAKALLHFLLGVRGKGGTPANRKNAPPRKASA